MSEQDEINLRRAQRDWQTKQDSGGMIAMVMCAAAVGGFLYFVSAPSPQSAGVLAVLLVGLMAACIRMVSCAAKVVEVRASLEPLREVRASFRPPRDQSNFVDVEVVESPRDQEYRKLPYYV